MTTREAEWYIIAVAFVCLYISNTITFESLDIHSKFIFAHPVYLEGIAVKFVYEGHRVKVKVTESKWSKVPFPQRKTSIGKNSGSITKSYSRKVCMHHGVFALTDRMV